MPTISESLGLEAFRKAWPAAFREAVTQERANAGDPPRPGFWMVRLVRNGPEVPARIYRPCPIEMRPDHWEPLDRVFHLAASIGDRECPVADLWSRRRDLREITLAQYEFEVDDMRWARRWAPDDPKANPHKPVDWTKNAIPF